MSNTYISDNPRCTQCSEILLAKLDCSNHPISGNTYNALRNQTDPKLKALIEKAIEKTKE